VRTFNHYARTNEMRVQETKARKRPRQPDSDESGTDSEEEG